MPLSLRRLWTRAFLIERPSIGLSLFRLAVAFTVGAHMIPSFFHMDENYLSTAFKTTNGLFFPGGLLALVARSPDWVVGMFTALFFIAWAAFALGLWAQLGAILMTLTCYYFYALNNFHIGTLSFDILLVTLFLMCCTGYHGDFLSLDSLLAPPRHGAGRGGDAQAYRRLRPFVIQRLLQLQLAWTFWYTALSKMSGQGNWLWDNPYYYLMRYPAIGVVRNFPFRGWLAEQPELCKLLGLTLIGFEYTLPFLWFMPRTRTFGILLGIAFQLMLWLTLHVPTIFLFLFPAMMLLFVPPERLVDWIQARRALTAAGPHGLLVYDGACGFCLASLQRLRVLDLFGWLDLRDFRPVPDLTSLHPGLTVERCRSEMVLIEPGGRITGGFEAFRRLCLRLPLLWPLAPLVYLPGAGRVGGWVYRWVAAHRYLLHRNPACATNQCGWSGDSTKT